MKKILKNTRDRKERERTEQNRNKITTRKKNRGCRRRSRSRIINPN